MSILNCDRDGRTRVSDDAFARLAVAHEGIFDHTHRHLATTDVHAHFAEFAGGHAGKADGLAQGRREHAGKEFAFAGAGVLATGAAFALLLQRRVGAKIE